MQVQETVACPVCELLGCTKGSGNLFTCRNCGRFSLTAMAVAFLPNLLDHPKKRAALSHAIWKAQRMNSPLEIQSENVESMLKNNPLPMPSDQADYLILWLGAKANCPSEFTRVEYAEVPAKIGAIGVKGACYILDYLNRQELIDIDGFGREAELPSSPGGNTNCRLTIAGWERYSLLQKGRHHSNRAFMAMPFSSNPDASESKLFAVYRRAAEQAGFDLTNPLLHHPQAGLIDDHLRVEIRTSCFVVAELTNGNQGAYWEAGFAEGLGKKVIYSCEQTIFEGEGSGRKGTHFDTNHLQTVVWQAEKLDEAGDKLKSIIRNTFPDKAKMVDG